MSAPAPKEPTTGMVAETAIRERFRAELARRRVQAQAEGDEAQVAKLDRMLDRLDTGRPLYTAGGPWTAPDPDAVVQGQRAQVEQARGTAGGELPAGWTEGGAYVERRRRHSAS